MMFRICGRTLNDQGKVTNTAMARCIFKDRSDAVSYLNKLTRLLRPDAGYEDEQDYWWIRNKGVVIRFTIQY